MRKLEFETEEERQNYLKEYQKQYYEVNKNRIKRLQEAVRHCPYCDEEVFRHRYKRHCKSAKHQKNVLEFDQT